MRVPEDHLAALARQKKSDGLDRQDTLLALDACQEYFCLRTHAGAVEYSKCDEEAGDGFFQVEEKEEEEEHKCDAAEECKEEEKKVGLLRRKNIPSSGCTHTEESNCDDSAVCFRTRLIEQRKRKSWADIDFDFFVDSMVQFSDSSSDEEDDNGLYGCLELFFPCFVVS
jgi:hypothetical protein